MVKTCFVGDPKSDKEGDGHAGGEAHDIYKRISLVFEEVAPGDEEVVFEHVRSWCQYDAGLIFAYQSMIWLRYGGSGCAIMIQVMTGCGRPCAGDMMGR